MKAILIILTFFLFLNICECNKVPDTQPELITIHHEGYNFPTEEWTIPQMQEWFDAEDEMYHEDWTKSDFMVAIQKMIDELNE